MRRLKKIFLGVFLSYVVVFSFTALFMQLVGKMLLIKKIEEVTHKKTTIEYCALMPPFHFLIKELNIEGLAKVESISLSPSMIYLITGRIGINQLKVIRPEITFERDIQQAMETTTATASNVLSSAVTSVVKDKKVKKPPLAIVFKRILVKEGKVYFVDHTVGPQGIRITLKDFNFELTNTYALPFSVITNFSLKARIPWQQGAEEGKIEGEGWINFFKRDMQAVFKITDIDGVYLYPYYSKWVDLEKSRIEKAKLNFTSNISGMNNNATVQCHLELTDIVRKPRPEEEPKLKEERITDTVLDMFRTLDQGKIVLDYSFHTKMDRPEFEIGDIKLALEDKLAQARGNGPDITGVFRLPGKLIEGTVRSATDISKAVIDGTFAVGNEFKKAVQDSFRKPVPKK